MRLPRRTWFAAAIAGVAVVVTMSILSSALTPAAVSDRGANAPVGVSVGGGDRGAGVDGPFTVVQAERHDVSAPLAGMPTQLSYTPVVDDPSNVKPKKIIAGRDGPGAPGRGASGSAALDPALQPAGPVSATSVSAPIQSFEGINNRNGVLPPDTNGDVGPNHYVQFVNLSLAVYSKSGTVLYGPTNGNTIWAGFGGYCETRNDGDPIVLYDPLADRWMVSQFALPGGAAGYHECIAISQTPDPTGAWYRYDFLYSTTKMNDYPHFGVWPDGYYMSVNQFTNGTSWGGQGVAVFERDKMLQGQPARMVKFDMYTTNTSDPRYQLGGMLPSDLDGPTPPSGAPNAFMQFDDDAWGYSPDQLQIWNFHVDWANTASSSFTKVAPTLPTAAFDYNLCNGARSCIPQQGTTAKLDTLADRLMYRLQYRNFGDHQSLVVNHTVDVDSADHAGIRWYELRNTGSGWVIFQQGTFSPDANNRWMASAAMNGSGGIALGYSVSAATMYPSIRYTGRVATDPLGTLPQGEGTIINGTGAQTHSASRWGDYSMLAVDPTDNCTFWFTSEYVQTTGSAPWRTRIASFTLPNCVAQPDPAPTPVPTPSPSPVPSPTPSPSPTPTPTQTAWIFPTTAAAVTSGAGDNNGYESNAANLFAFDGNLATDANSGTGSSQSCTSTLRDKELLSGYGFGLPGAAAVKGIEVQLRGQVNSSSSSPKFCVQLSWNGGTSWTTGKLTANLGTTLTTYTLGTTADLWGRAWSAADFGTNFRVRVIDVASSTSRTFSLDGAAVRLTY